MCFCTKHLRRALHVARHETRGQASVEAAFLLPVLFFLLALLLQPLCIFYTRATMALAASEGVRVMTTMPQTSSAEYGERFVRRRLEAIPELGIFHVGNSDSWEIEASGGEAEKEASIVIRGQVQPLPLLGVLALPFTGANGVIELQVEASAPVRPDWLGGDYETWVSAWDA